MPKVCIAATQMRCTEDVRANIAAAEGLVQEAAARGAQVILLQELFETLYFCQKEDPRYFSLAATVEENPAIRRFSRLAKDLGVVIPVSFFERKNQAYFNSAAMIDADGKVLGMYRKTHIPDGPGYEEKFYFTPGDTGFRVWQTRYGRIGLGICWDQWFPEAARSMALMGAQILLYPTAIGSEPENPGLDSKAHWQTAMLGHAAANMVPVVASNRIGTETIGDSSITFYGSSFICDHRGQILTQANPTDRAVILAELDLEASDADRRAWGLFRDRRPAMYRTLMTKDGSETPA